MKKFVTRDVESGFPIAVNKNKEPARGMLTGSVIGGKAVTSTGGREPWTRMWCLRRRWRGRAAVGPERDYVVETIGAAEACWNIVEASSRIIDRVTSHRWGLAIKFDPDTDLRDGISLVGVAATEIIDSGNRRV